MSIWRFLWFCNFWGVPSARVKGVKVGGLYGRQPGTVLQAHSTQIPSRVD